MRLRWPLTGRSNELRLIEAAISDPNLSGIVVCGAAGVGKSRVAREALNSAAATGREARWVVGTSSARTIPLGALAPWREAVGTNSLDLVRDVIASMTSASASEAEVVVGVDDVPLLDDLSTFVVQQIIQRRAAKVVLTLRDDEPTPAATQELWKESQFKRLELQPLSQDKVMALVSAALDGPVDVDAARRLWELTRGNPLYLQNIVEQEVLDGRLSPQHGYWRWLGDPVVPPGLVGLIEERIGALPTSVSDVIDALAVGAPIELQSLRRITDAAAVEEADARGLINLEPVGRGVQVQNAHPLYGEVRRRCAAPTRLRRLRGLVASELARADERDDLQVVVRRAALCLDSDLEPDADLLLRGAQAAVFLVDMTLADRLADAAHRAGAGAEAKFIRAYVQSFLGHGHDADHTLASVSSAELTDVEHARLTFLRATNRLLALADSRGAKRLLDDASHTTPPQARDCIDAALTVYWAATGKPDQARQSSKNLALAQLPAPVARITTWAITLAAAEAGRTADAVSAAGAGYPVTVRGFLAIADAHTSALLLSGQIHEAQKVAETLRQRAADFPRPELNPRSEGVAGRAALGAGRLDTARSLLTAAAEALTASGETNGWGYRYQIPRATALAALGYLDEAAAALAVAEAMQHPGWQCIDYELALARTWVAACQGTISEAIRTVLAGAEKARANGQFAAEVLCLQTAAQFGDRSTAHRLRQLEEIVEGPRAAIAARFAEALRAGDAAGLADVSAEFESIGDLVAAADAAAHAATVYRRQDLRGSALACSSRAEALADQCGGAQTPALRQASGQLPLTDREREIVMLLGEGLSNREIAARLRLSVRTVEAHIYRAMAKTRTGGRGDLAQLIRRRRE